MLGGLARHDMVAPGERLLRQHASAACATGHPRIPLASWPGNLLGGLQLATIRALSERPAPTCMWLVYTSLPSRRLSAA